MERGVLFEVLLCAEVLWVASGGYKAAWGWEDPLVVSGFVGIAWYDGGDVEEMGVLR